MYEVDGLMFLGEKLIVPQSGSLTCLEHPKGEANLRGYLLLSNESLTRQWETGYIEADI